MLKYKLTTQENTTYNNTKWAIGIPYQTDGKQKKLCTNSWLHYYHLPELAIIMNSYHANIYKPKLYECEAEGEHLDDFGLKGGCTKLTLKKQISTDIFTHNRLVNIGLSFYKTIINEFKPDCQIILDYIEPTIEKVIKWINNYDSISADFILKNNENYKNVIIEINYDSSKLRIAKMANNLLNSICSSFQFGCTHVFVQNNILMFISFLIDANITCDYKILEKIIKKTDFQNEYSI